MGIDPHTISTPCPSFCGELRARESSRFAARLADPLPCSDSDQSNQARDRATYAGGMLGEDLNRWYSSVVSERDV